MSNKRHSFRQGEDSTAEGTLVRSYAVRLSSGHVIARHQHDWHQLVYATDGAMWVHTPQGGWVVPPHRAVWVPGGIEHAVEMAGAVLMQTVYLARKVSPALPTRCCAVNVSPLLRELIRHIIALGTLDRAVPAQSRLIGVLVDQVVTLPTAPLELPFPSDVRARRVAEWLYARPSEPASVEQMADVGAASPRTIERLFLRETGMTFGRWRQQMRLLHALRLLAKGKSVTAVAFDVGYESASAFVAAFRRFFGTTPARYFD